MAKSGKIDKVDARQRIRRRRQVGTSLEVQKVDAQKDPGPHSETPSSAAEFTDSGDGARDYASPAPANATRNLHAAEMLLRELVERHCPGQGERVAIHFTNNSCTMVSKYERGGAPHLRLHYLFSKAPRSLLNNLVRFCFLRIRRTTSRRIRAELMDFVEDHREETLVVYPKTRFLPPRGEVFDLRGLVESVQREHVPELESLPDVAWTRRAHRTLMGKWVPTPAPHPNLVLINRLLDNADVPHFYVEFVVFHELLHELMPISRACGRWVHHPPEFKRREKDYPLYREAQLWEEENLGRIYGSYARRRRRRS